MTIDARSIRQAEAELTRLDEALKHAFRLRGSSRSEWKKWKLAAERFRNYESPVFGLWSDAARIGILQGDGSWRESAMLYLALNPRFFRSGFLRDRMCHLLKQCELLPSERRKIGRSLLSTLVLRPSVGRFRHDCRLAASVADEEFLENVRELSNRENDDWTRGRARRMLSAIEQRNAERERSATMRRE